MSEQYEPSYYEIALTGRQVLAAFVILLVCLVAAFFSGVWVGREEAKKDRGTQVADVEAPERVTEPDAAAEEPTPEAPSTAASAQDGLDALSFFGEADEADGEPVSRSEPESGAAEPARPEPGPAEPDSGGQEAAGAETPPASPAGSPTGGLAGGDVVIQVFSSPDRSKAQEILERLQANDFRAFISPLVDAGETFYRVRVGPFEYETDARRVAAELRRKLDLETWITR